MKLRARRRAARAAATLAAAVVAIAALTPAASAATFGSGVSAARNADGRLEVFASDFDGDILHAWQRPGGGWSGWTEMPGGGTFALARPAVGRNADGRLEVFAQSGTRMYHSWQLASGGWSGWHDFGGSFRTTSFTQPIAANNADGRLEVFAIDGDGRLAHRYRLPAGGWSSWLSLGGSFHRSAVPAVARNPDGRLEVFVLGGNGAVQHIWQTVPNGGWSGWASLGGSFMQGELWGPAVAANASGRLEVFATASNRQLHHKWQLSTGGWSTWRNLDGFLDKPVAARNAAGRIEIFVAAGTGPRLGTNPTKIRHIFQSENGWSSWRDLSGGGPGTYQTPTVAMNADGRLEVLSQVFSGSGIFHTWQEAPVAGWSAWSTLTGG